MYTKKNFISFAILLITSLSVLLSSVYANNVHLGDSLSKKSPNKITDNRPNRPVFNNIIPSDFESFMFKMTSIRTGLSINKGNIKSQITAASKSNLNTSVDQSKPLENVRIYPNPIADQVNLTYSLKKDGLVNVKILDLLGNEVMVLLSKRLNAGEQNNTFYLNSKLNSGFYFIRVSSDSDSIIKRISIL